MDPGDAILDHLRQEPGADSDAVADRMMAEHDRKGFAFVPSNRTPIDGDITYGDTSMSVDYVAANFPRWQVVGEHCNPIDPYQLLLFVRPA